MTALAPAGAAGLPDRRAPIDELDRAIVELAGRINAATHDFLVLVRRFDERAGWLGWSFQSCAEWLHWRCDISVSAAREKVRVAHALKTLPAIGRAFAEGRLSYSKVRALTRVAGPANEDALLSFALTTTAARLEERCRELRCGTAGSLEEAVRARARRGLSLRRASAEAPHPSPEASCNPGVFDARGIGRDAQHRRFPAIRGRAGQPFQQPLASGPRAALRASQLFSIIRPIWRIYN